MSIKKSQYNTTSSAYDIALKKAPNIPLRFPEGTRFCRVLFPIQRPYPNGTFYGGNSYGCASSGSLNLNSPICRY